MTLSVRRRIADIARAEPDRTALVGFDTDLAQQVLSWREFAGRVADVADALGAALDRRTRSCAVVSAGNTLPAAIGIAAALTAEVPVFPLNPGTPPAERDALLGLLGRRFGHCFLMDAQLRPQRMDLPTGPESWGGGPSPRDRWGRPTAAPRPKAQANSVPLRTCWPPARPRAFRRSPPGRDHCATIRLGRLPW
jgi:bile acid-coenzyme A ligase